MLESICLENASETVRLDEAPVRTLRAGDSAWGICKIGEERPSVKRNYRPYRRARRGISDPACTSSRIYTGISGIRSRPDPERTLSRRCGTTPVDRWSHFDRILHCFQSIPGEFTRKETQTAVVSRGLGNAFGAVKTVELAGADCSGTVRHSGRDVNERSK